MAGIVPALQLAFEEKSRQETISNFKVACTLGIVLVPAFSFIDFAVYPKYALEFLTLRFGCSAAIGLFLAAMLSRIGLQFYRYFGVLLVLLPGTAIAYMIYRTEGAESPYYAGLNLVLLVVGFVLRWTFKESLTAVGLIVGEYLSVCYLNNNYGFHGIRLNNFFFLLATGVIVVTGSYFFSRLRFREFQANYELAVSQRELEISNHQLSDKTTELERTLVELRQTQDQLVTKEKQASLGVWSAGIIHEMNNPLNFARTGLYALRNKEKHLPPEQQPDFKELVADIEDGIKRVHMIVSDLRTYAHPGKEDDHEEIPVEEAFRVALRFFSADLQGRVEITKKIPDSLLVFVNRNKLIQVLGNLLQNSIDALKLKTFSGDQHPVITISGEQSNGRGRITIRDNGTGIKKEDLGKIFDPFFTTKDVGQGMGLGLGICYRIVQGFGGTISVRSEAGEFCEFTLDLPAERPDAAAN